MKFHVQLFIKFRIQHSFFQVDLLRSHVADVDVDGSGEIDIGEFLKLMRKSQNIPKNLCQAERIANLNADGVRRAVRITLCAPLP